MGTKQSTNPENPSAPHPFGVSTTGGRSLANRVLRGQSENRLEPGLEAEIEREEFAADLSRFRKLLPFAIALFGLTSVSDWIAARLVEPQPLTPFLWIRGVTMGLLTVLYCAVYFWRPTRFVFGVIANATFTIAAFAVSSLCLFFGGATSPIGAAVTCVMIVSGFSLPRPWRKAVPSKLTELISFPLTILVGSLFFPRIAAQLRSPAGLKAFSEILIFLLTNVLLLVYGGHVYWRVRRSAIEAKQGSRCRLIEPIGAGGMGEVWKAYHPGLGKEVAVKILRAVPSDEEAIARFEREIRATAELVHPNTVRVLDCGVTGDELWYFTMELLRGESLAALLQREGVLPWDRAARMILQACRALSEAHGRGLVHRDIKPDNLFIVDQPGETDFIKVLDFGIAKVVEEANPLTGEGVLIGTLRFMAIEQERGEATDERTDVYALGAVLYCLITGVPPVPGDTLPELMLNRQRLAILPPSVRNEVSPLALDAIVLKALEKDPAARFQTAKEFADALVALLASVKGTAEEAPVAPKRRPSNDSMKTVRVASVPSLEPAQEDGNT